MAKRKETLRSEWVKCGKADCGSCPHGPYWYAYWREGGKLHKRYIGRELPHSGPKAEPKAEETVHPWDAIFNERTASLALAFAILGLGGKVPFEQARDAYRKLAKEHHPDRGGDARMSARVSSAWSYLRATYKWS